MKTFLEKEFCLDPFEQVSIDGYQMSLAGDREGAKGFHGLMSGGAEEDLRSHVGGGLAGAWGGYTVRSNASLVIATWGPAVNIVTDKHD